MLEVAVTVRRAKLQSNCHCQRTNRPNARPDAKSVVSKHWREIPCLMTTRGSWLLWEGCQGSQQPCVHFVVAGKSAAPRGREPGSSQAAGRRRGTRWTAAGTDPAGTAWYCTVSAAESNVGDVRDCFIIVCEQRQNWVAQRRWQLHSLSMIGLIFFHWAVLVFAVKGIVTYIFVVTYVISCGSTVYAEEATSEWSRKVSPYILIMSSVNILLSKQFLAHNRIVMAYHC